MEKYRIKAKVNIEATVYMEVPADEVDEDMELEECMKDYVFSNLELDPGEGGSYAYDYFGSDIQEIEEK